jgi:hypothetical protein
LTKKIVNIRLAGADLFVCEEYLDFSAIVLISEESREVVFSCHSLPLVYSSIVNGASSDLE